MKDTFSCKANLRIKFSSSRHRNHNAIFSHLSPNPALSKMSSGCSTQRFFAPVTTRSIFSPSSVIFYLKSPLLSSALSLPLPKNSSKTLVRSVTLSSGQGLRRFPPHSSSNNFYSTSQKDSKICQYLL